jgi:hypothetical protein
MSPPTRQGRPPQEPPHKSSLSNDNLNADVSTDSHSFPEPARRLILDLEPVTAAHELAERLGGWALAHGWTEALRRELRREVVGR